MSGVSDLLFSQIYPAIDAVDTGLLEEFNPSERLNGSKWYYLNCPRCGERRAYYAPGGSTVNCSRRNNCESTSLWEIATRSSSSNKETLEILASLAGVTLPDQTSSPSRVNEKNVSIHVKNVCQSYLYRNQDLMKELMVWRGLSAEEIKECGWGFYPNSKYIRASFKKAMEIETAVGLGLIVNDEDKDWFRNRFVNFWGNREGVLYPAGRARPNSKSKLKYIFPPLSTAFTKDVPYKFSDKKESTLFLAEGMFDAESARLAGFWAGAIGQAVINISQANYLFSRGVREATYITDGDPASWVDTVNSIYNCELAALKLNIVPLGDGMDDLDTVRKKHGNESVKSLCEQSLSPGHYLAGMYLHAIESGDDKLARVISCGVDKLSDLTFSCFISTCKTLSVPVRSKRPFHGLDKVGI